MYYANNRRPTGEAGDPFRGLGVQLLFACREGFYGMEFWRSSRLVGRTPAEAAACNGSIHNVEDGGEMEWSRSLVRESAVVECTHNEAFVIPNMTG